MPKMFKPADFIIIAIILVMFGTSLAFLWLRATASADIEIYVDGTLYSTAPLSINRTITIQHAGNKNIIEISEGAASMIHANCPDEICMRMPPISMSHEAITCLPNRVLVITRNTRTNTDAVVQ